MNNYQILVDSDAFVAWFKADDIFHPNVKAIFTQIEQERLVTATTSLVVAETATILSNRVGQSLAYTFLDFVEQLPVIHVSEDIQKEALTLFREQAVKGTSVVDCANVVVMRHFSIPRIFSFDKAYSKKFGLEKIT